MKSPHQKFGLSLTLAVFTFVTLAGSFFTLTPARAQWTIVGDLPRMAEEIATQIKEGLGIAILNGALRAVSYFMRKIAYESAVWMASGGKGQSPLQNTKSFGKFLEDTAGEAFGEALSAIEDQFGLTLCQIPDVKLDLALRIGLRNLNSGPPVREGKCSFQDFKKAWGADAWKSRYGGKNLGDALSKSFNASLKVEDTDFGVYLDSVAKIDQNVIRSREVAKEERQEGQGTENLTDYISGNILTPAQQVKKYVESHTPDEQEKADQATIYSAIGSGFVQVIPSTISTFLNTLAGTMLKNFMTKGSLPFGVCVGEFGGEDCKNAPSVASFAGTGGRVGRAAAQAVFSELLTPKIGVEAVYDIISQLSNCPEAPSAFNCRADSGLVSALQEANTYGGQPVTIREAMEKGWLHKEWRLLPPNRPENQMKESFRNVYTYANIKALRLARILPLGFEIAALKSNPDDPWTLEEVVGVVGKGDGWYDCTDVDHNGIPEYDPTKNFCHLIDPNWIIKAPASRCNASVFGNQPLSGGVPNRLKECVDLSSVVAYNADKTPMSYAYCAREKNIWKSSADVCESQYATCLAYTDPNGQQVGYLQRTLDTGDCSVETVGCSAYSLWQNASGAWQSPAYSASVATFNNGIYFNNKLSSSCGPNSAGCSAFKLVDNKTANPLYLRKAPDYLRCYNYNLSAGLKWPTTTADLSRLSLNPRLADCAQYSQACISDEVGCNMFTAVKSGEQIPGKFTPAVTITNADGKNEIIWKDQCAEQCDGYDAYVRLPDNYSNGSLVDYIVPSAEAACARADVGCSSFTNMGAVYEGGERVEHFSFLRSCIKPDESNKDKYKNYYTYEGSTVGGYQLKVYTLEKYADRYFPTEKVGGPKYFYKDTSDKNLSLYLCNESAYKAGTSTPDCRQFNDEEGNIYYRLLGKTIVVSDQCTSYRLNSTEMELAEGVNNENDCGVDNFWSSTESKCRRCFQNGRYDKGFCYYDGLPSGVVASEGESQSCSATVESCHAYKGNAGNNIEKIASLDFESADALSGWGGTPAPVLSVESIKAGGHSVGYISGNGALQWSVKANGANTAGLAPRASYILSFWAKGKATGVLNVVLENGAPLTPTVTVLGQIQLSDQWHLYEFGAKELDGTSTSTNLVIGNSNGSVKTIYLDNLRLTKVRESIYLVQKKIVVDKFCDADQTDNLPGEALGCKKYTVPNIPSPFYLKNFSYLCRENAIGCTAVLDTQNTLDTDKPKAYNVWLSGNGGDLVRVKLSDKEFSCQIPVGEDGCYVKKVEGVDPNIVIQTQEINDGNGNAITETWTEINTIIEKKQGNSWVSTSNKPRFNNSSVHIPSDTTSTAPIYLVANKQATCNQVDLGCTYAGLQKRTPAGIQFTTVTIKNDPANYDNTICQSEAVGCNVYTSGAGNYYFKDPVSVGQKICIYKPRATVAGADASGWFWKDVGKCAGTDYEYCSTNSDCGEGIVCENIGNWPCYPNYRKNGNAFGIWSYGDKTKYNNFAGSCPTEQSGCTEFIDSNDRDTISGLFRSYFWINNSKITEGDCAGQISLKDGCALFTQADIPRKQWNTAESYAASERNDSRRVDPIDGTTAKPADANRIIKVVRDRECGEWLQCLDSHTVFDPDTGWKEVCDTIGRCNEAPDIPEQGAIADCSNLIDSFSSPELNKVLTTRDYQSRDVTWGGKDYSGYAFLDMYQPDMLTQYNIKTGDDPDWRLVRQIPCGGENCFPATAVDKTTCANNDNPCGAGSAGICKNKTCVQTPFGGKVFDNSVKAPKPTCRAYPDEKSPFPFTRLIDRSSAFENVNECNELTDPSDSTSDSILKKVMGCECNYTAAEYGDGAIVRYFNDKTPNSGNDIIGAIPSSTPGVPPGICLGGDKDGFKCGNDSECESKDSAGKVVLSGSCQKRKKQSTRIGWQGYCLEPDYSRNIWADEKKFACLTWLPVGPIAGAADIYNQFIDAGYVADSTKGLNGEYYCLNSQGYVEESSSIFKINDNYTVDTRPEITAENEGDFTVFISGYPLRLTTDRMECDADQIDWGTDGKHPYSSPSPEGYNVPTNWCVDESGEGTDDNIAYRDFIPATFLEGKFKQIDIEYVEFKVAIADDEDPAVDKSFKVYPNIYKTDGTPYLTAQVDIKTPPEDSTNPGLFIAGNLMNKQNFPAMFYSSHLTGTSADWYLGYDEGTGNSDGYLENITTGGDDSSGISGHLFDDDLEINGSVVPPTGLGLFTHDDLHHICDESNNKDVHSGNWHGIALHFNSDTKRFLGYWVINCNQSGNNGDLQYNVTFKLRSACRSIADTTVDTTENSAVGWTNRLWGGKARYNGSDEFPYSAFLYPEIINFDAELKPFGSFETDVFFSSLFNTPFNLGDNPADIKVAYLTDAETILCKNGAGPYSACTLNLSAGADLPGYRMAVPFSCTKFSNVDSRCGYMNNEGLTFVETRRWATYDNRKSVINQVFVKPKSIYDFNFNKSGSNYYTGYTSTTNCNDTGETSELFSHFSSPRVRPVGKCSEIDPTKCEEVNYPGLTINNEYNKDIPLLDSPAKVVLRFYAYADADRMPLRSMIVDWGDGTPGYESGEQSFFRNHRGSPTSTGGYRCEEYPASSGKKICRANIGAGIQGPGKQYYPERDCEVDADCAFLDACILDNSELNYKPTDFGHIIDRTCDNTYYQFEHFYRCGPESVNWYPTCTGNESLFLTGCCIFQPRVQVKDNWGWCNGTCRDNDSDTGISGDTSPGKTGCYDDNDFDDPGCFNPDRRYVGDGDNPSALAQNNECADHGGAWTKFGNGANKIFVAPTNLPTSD